MIAITKEQLESYAELELQHNMTAGHCVGPEMHPSIHMAKWPDVLTDAEKEERMRKMFGGQVATGLSNRTAKVIWNGCRCNLKIG